MDIRRLMIDDSEQLRALRLEALATSPEVFGASYEDEERKPLEDFVGRIEKNIILGAFDGGVLIGMLGLLPRQRMKSRHKADLWGMYVKGEYREKGIGGELMGKILEIARGLESIEQVKLSAVVSNDRAVSLYESFGFMQYGLEKHALKYGDEYFDQVHMVLFL